MSRLKSGYFWLGLICLLQVSSGIIPQKSRQCCLYAKNEKVCESKDLCSVKKNDFDSLNHPDLKQCQVVSDSKRHKESPQECFQADIGRNPEVSDHVNRSMLNNIRVSTYLLDKESTFGNAEIFGFDVLIPYSNIYWETARFRLKNNHGFENNCLPRCVQIQRNNLQVSNDTEDYISYDCELGIYHTETKIVKHTMGSTYSFDICLDQTCQSFLISMPTSSKEEPHLILVESQPLIQDGHLIMHFPPEAYGNSNITIRIESIQVLIYSREHINVSKVLHTRLSFIERKLSGSLKI